MPPALVLERVSHAYGERLAVDDVSLTVAAGEIFCLLGPSGCGKSTTLRLAAGLERLQRGRITIGGTVVAGQAVAVPPERRGVGLVFQDYALFPHLPVLENVAFGITGRSAERRSAARAMLERVGLADKAASYPHQLSGGEQQRVALARALAPRPGLMLMDEPFSGLDIRLRDAVRDDTLALLKASGIAGLLVTHDPEEAMRMADRIAVMRDGRLIQQGAPVALYDHPVDGFVARFFGEVNTLSGTVRGGGVDSPWGRLDAPAGTAEGSRVEVLIRPEALVVGGPGPGQVAARVSLARSLGPYGLAHLALTDGTRLIARLSGGAPPMVGSHLHIGLVRNQVFVFPVAHSISTAPREG